MVGSATIAATDVLAVFIDEGQQVNNQIIFDFRMPKAITAVLAGAALAVSGLMMQTLFRNPLADPYILGVSSGAGLGVAVITLAAGIIPFLGNHSWSLIVAAIIGSLVILSLVLGVSFRVQSAVTLLIVGIMFGTIASALIQILQHFGDAQALKQFVSWSFGNLTTVSWKHMHVLAPLITIGLLLAYFVHRRLDVLLLGDNYARGLGISIVQIRMYIILITALLAGSITAFTGPIAFVGVAVPHIVRGLFKTSSHAVLIPATAICGAILLLMCDLIAQLPSYTLPLNTVTSLFGAPVIMWILLRKK